MTMPLILVLVMVVLFAAGVYLLLDRSLTRVLLGFLLVGNATNLLIFLTSGTFGAAPIYGVDPADMSDPLPQAFILTSIVITFGISAFILGLIYRNWHLARQDEDEVRDDAHDQELAEAESLTTEEVTDEELSQTKEFASSSDPEPASQQSDESTRDEHGASSNGAAS